MITIGGWTRLEGSSVAVMSLLWAGLYMVFALLVARWNRGILPVAAALAIILAIFAAIAAPEWFERSKEGLDPPPLPDDLLGLLTILVVPVQLLLITVAMIGFNQNGTSRRSGRSAACRWPARTRTSRSRRPGTSRPGRAARPPPYQRAPGRIELEELRLRLARLEQVRARPRERR